MIYKHESAEILIKETKKTLAKKMPGCHRAFLYLGNLYTNTIAFFGFIIFFMIILF